MESGWWWGGGGGGVLEHVCKWRSSRQNSSLQVIQWARVRPPHTASRGSHVSNVRRCGRVSFFFFFSFPKVNLHSHLPFLIRPLSLWNVTWERKKREDRGEKQSITIIPSKKKMFHHQFERLIHLRLSRARQAGRQAGRYFSIP